MAYRFDELEVFRTCFEEEIAKYEIEKFEVNIDETLYLLNDSLCLLFLKQKYSDIYVGSVPRPRNKEERYAGASIIELSPNDLGKIYNHQQYITKVEKITKRRELYYIISYEQFRGIRHIEEIVFDEPKKVFEYDKISPRLCLRERFETWPGIRRDRIFCEFEDNSGNIVEFVVGSDPRRPLEHLNKFCRAIANSGEIKRELLSYIYSIEKFEDALLSWDDFDFKKVISEHLTYFSVIEYDKKNKDWMEWLSESVRVDWSVKYKDYKREQYEFPPTRWVSEYNLFRLIVKLFPNELVLYQHRPLYLRRDGGGQMSYDIYISGKRIAIEYQGKQHFEPVAFFGGEESFKETVKRDQEKKLKSKENNVELIYFNYWEPINKETVLEKLHMLVSESE